MKYHTRHFSLKQALFINTCFFVLPLTTAEATPLSLADQIACQTAIEQVRWAHTIWPDANSESKPPLSEIISSAEIETKVLDSRRQTAALAALYDVEIEPIHLQAELDRMALASKAPDQLRELYAALDNDPARIAACLVQPNLVRQQLHRAYQWDAEHHGAVRAQARSELANGTRSARSHEIIYRREDHVAKTVAERGAGDPVELYLGEDEWIERVAQLEANDELAKASPTGALRETENAFVYQRILDRTDDALTVQVQVWPKRSFDAWWHEEARRWSPEPPAIIDDLKLAPVGGDEVDFTKGGNEEFWQTETGVPSRRRFHTAVWTGSEMIVWGGEHHIEGLPYQQFTNLGARYNPGTDTWVSTSMTNVPAHRTSHTAIWSGTEMIVWGGVQTDGWYPLNTGGRYNPLTNTWKPVTQMNAPSGRAHHSAIWTGKEMIVWGGSLGQAASGTGARYDPLKDSWLAVSEKSAPEPRISHKAVWTGSSMIVWGGHRYNNWPLSTGAVYDPEKNSWAATSNTNAPEPAHSYTAVWAGDQMIVWGAVYDVNDDAYHWDGGRYDPDNAVWVVISTENAPPVRMGHKVVWTGSEMMVWGGYDLDEEVFPAEGGRYDPVNDSWKKMSVVNAPAGRTGHTAVWTGREMIVWGGAYIDQTMPGSNTGGRYEPTSDSWIATSGGGYPNPRWNHVSVWTGTHMIVWGGIDPLGVYVNSGGLYDPALHSWAPTSEWFVPEGAESPSAVWTGSQMIVWGGSQFWGPTDKGGRYRPATNTWHGVSTDSAPEARYGHSTVWTGSEMIVWGGRNAQNQTLGTGARYHLISQTWSAPLPAANAPSPRTGHSAVWTGDEMLIWGGYNTQYQGNGAIYRPQTNTWSPMSSVGAPSGRVQHAAVWTGQQMIVWGGMNTNYQLADGARYRRATNSWTKLPVSGAPAGRRMHTAVWTGDEMMIWGGYGEGGYLQTGGRYHLAQNDWVSTATANAPEGRYGHSAVWTGETVIVFGGMRDMPNNDLAIYSPGDGN